MSSDRFDPPRVGRGDHDALQALVRGRREGPTEGALHKIESGLAAAGVIQPSSTAGRDKRLFYPKLAGLLLIVAGGLLLGRQTWHESKLPASIASTPPSAPDEPSTPETKTAVAETLAPATEEAAKIAPSAPPNGTISVNELPTVTPPVVPAPAIANASANASAGAKTPAIPVSELALIQRAQSALATDPPRALKLTDEHGRTFPSGEFVQEREVIAVEALARLGRKDEARERATALLKRFPRTPYAARLELATSAPLSKATEKKALNPNPNDPVNAPAAPAH